MEPPASGSAVGSKRSRQGGAVVVVDEVDFSLVGGPSKAQPAATSTPPPQSSGQNTSGPKPYAPRSHHAKRMVGRFGASSSTFQPAASIVEQSSAAADSFLSAIDDHRAAQQRLEQCAESLRVTVSGSSVFDLRHVLFQDGVPDVEPWDSRLVPIVGKYAVDGSVRANDTSIGDTVFHPAAFSVVPVQPPAPTEYRLVKTQDELRADRRERLRQKQAQEAAMKKSSAGGPQHKDKLSLNRVNMDQLPGYALNPLRADEAVRAEVTERNLEHLRRNYENKIAALPHQIVKKEVDDWRDATKNSSLQVFHVFPTNPDASDCVNRLRNFANEKDARMRGFLLWTARTDLLIVLCGGEKPMRHVSKWIFQMRWGQAGTDNQHAQVTSSAHPTSDPSQYPRKPEVTHCFTSRLSCLSEFSFHLPKRAAEDTPRTIEQLKALEQTLEPVFVKMVDTAKEADVFMRQQQPAYGPLSSLLPLWRSAFGY